MNTTIKSKGKKERFAAFFQKNKHALLLLYFLIYLPWFHYLEQTVTTNFHVIHMKLDDYIPFCEYFIIPYFLWFAYVAWGVIYFLLKDKEDFIRLCTVLFTGMTIFLIISTIYPNGHYLRPTVFERDNIFVHMVQWLYATDTPTNLFPSIHVYNSIAIHMAVIHSRHFREKKGVQTASFLMMISIILSTVLLKQHSVFDLATGVLLAVFMGNLVYTPETAPVSAERRKYERRLKRV